MQCVTPTPACPRQNPDLKGPPGTLCLWRMATHHRSWGECCGSRRLCLGRGTAERDSLPKGLPPSSRRLDQTPSTTLKPTHLPPSLWPCQCLGHCGLSRDQSSGLSLASSLTCPLRPRFLSSLHDHIHGSATGLVGRHSLDGLSPWVPSQCLHQAVLGPTALPSRYAPAKLLFVLQHPPQVAPLEVGEAVFTRPPSAPGPLGDPRAQHACFLMWSSGPACLAWANEEQASSWDGPQGVLKPPLSGAPRE